MGDLIKKATSKNVYIDLLNKENPILAATEDSVILHFFVNLQISINNTDLNKAWFEKALRAPTLNTCI